MPRDSALHACPEFLADFSDFIDGRMTPERRAEIQMHLDCCEGCLRHLAAYRQGVEAWRDGPEVEVDSDDFWLGLKIRLAEPAAPARSRSAWRAPALAGIAVAALALATLWLGTRIDAGFQRVAERPVVVEAPAASVAALDAAAAGAADGATSLVTPVVAASPVTQVAVAGSGGVTARRQSGARRGAGAARATASRPSDSSLERQFEDLRGQIELAGWLGDPYLEASSRSFEGGPGEGVRIQTASWSY